MEKMRELKFTLEEPLEFNGVTYAELTLVRCKGKHLKRTDGAKGPNGVALALFAAMASIPLPAMEEIENDDFQRLSIEAAPLLGKSAVAALAAAAAEEEAATALTG